MGLKLSKENLKNSDREKIIKFLNLLYVKILVKLFSNLKYYISVI